MSHLSRELYLPVCLGIGLALYAYNVLLVPPRGEAKPETASKAASVTAQAEPQPAEPPALKPQQVEPQPVKLAPLKPKLKPKVAARPDPEVTGAIGPQPAAGPKPAPQPAAGPKPADSRKHAIVPEPGPAAASDGLPKVPGIRVASAAPQAPAFQSPDATRWSPAVGYAPLVKSSKAKPAMADRALGPPKAKRSRYARRPYRVRHTNFRVVIGVGPRW